MSSDPRPAPPPSHGHVCFAYDDPASFAEHARAFLADGVTAGQRVWYVAPARPPAAAGQGNAPKTASPSG